MQDIHDYSMTGAGGGGGGSTVRFFGEGGGGDRRMRVHQNSILNHHQSLKCPRCNSLNTKFCYYNNYNHSQPRHFCKSCRRYWTKGGVLRNVPVGGGCRKSKHSKSKQPPPSSAPSTADKPTTAQNGEEKPSSSESSSLTASTAVATAAEWSTFLNQGSSDSGVFSELDGFTSIETRPFGFGGNTVQQQFEDRTAQIDPTMGFEPLDWRSGGGNQPIFDLTSAGDHAYWSQQDQHDFYLPQF